MITDNRLFLNRQRSIRKFTHYVFQQRATTEILVVLVADPSLDWRNTNATNRVVPL